MSWRPCRTTRCCGRSRRLDARVGCRDSAWPWAFSAAWCCCWSSTRVHLRRWRRSRIAGLAAADGQNVRAAVLLAAAWFALFALPVFIVVPPPTPSPRDRAETVGLLGAYRTLWVGVVGEWRRDRNIVYYLLASAVFRDGLAGVFDVRRDTGRQRVRHFGCRRAVVRRGRERDRRSRCVARRVWSTTGSVPNRSSSDHWPR